jgi:UDP-N-acetylmuramoyl-tripeptide--D-alanyl-D-alanine ligase
VQLSDVWQALIGKDAEPPAPLAATAITHIVVDSRAATSGSLFVALRGEKADGNLYVPSAFDRGAVVAIAEPHAAEQPGLCATLIEPDGSFSQRGDVGTRGHGSEQAVSPCPPVPVAEQNAAGGPYIFVVPDSLAALQKLAAYWRAHMPAVAIAITGSVGKTTTKETVANVLTQRYRTLRSEGNLNNEIGLPLTLLRLAPEHERAVLEMGMYSLGEIARLCELARPRIGIVTNVGPTHLERLGTIERIAEAKSELVRSLPSAEDGGVAILNADDVRVRAMAGQTRARVFTYGLNDAADLWADEVTSEGLEGIRFRIHYNGEAFHVHLPMLGRHSVHTALRGAAVGLVDGLSWTEILNGLADVSGQLRLIATPGLHDTTLIDDTYNASPVSMLAALNLLEDIANSKHRCVIVLGGMLELGAYEEEGHRLVGGRAAQVLKAAHAHGYPGRGKLVTVGQRARWIAEEAIAAGLAGADVYPVENNQDALAVLQGLLQPGDIVLVKGSRGQAMEGIVDALSRPRETRTA